MECYSADDAAAPLVIRRSAPPRSIWRESIMMSGSTSWQTGALVVVSGGGVVVVVVSIVDAASETVIASHDDESNDHFVFLFHSRKRHPPLGCYR